VVRVSQLEVAGRESTLVDALRVVEPRLKALRVLDLGDGARIYADLGQRPFVPVSMMGVGTARVLTIVAAIALQEAPVMFVDEIGAGLHYETLAGVWKVIVNTALKHSVQIFATTHSMEAIKAAVDGSEGHENELALLRLTRRDGEIRVTAVEDEGIRAAVGFGFELR
jgi:AAA15 family ATPase/GTPase